MKPSSFDDDGGTIMEIIEFARNAIRRRLQDTVRDFWARFVTCARGERQAISMKEIGTACLF